MCSGTACASARPAVARRSTAATKAALATPHRRRTGFARPLLCIARRATGAEATRWYPCASDADLRVQVPERAFVRGVPRYERARTDELRGLRCSAARARSPSGRGALQRLGFLLDGLRPRLAEGGEGIGRRLVLLGRRLVVGLGLVVLARVRFVERGGSRGLGEVVAPRAAGAERCRRQLR